MGEVVDCIQGYEKKLQREQKKRKAEMQDETYMLFMQALQIGNVISCMFDKTKKINGLEVYYPGLYKNLNTDDEASQTEQFTEQEEGDKHKLTLEIEAYKADMDDFVFRHNLAMSKKRGESSGKNDIGEAASDHRGTD